jgi:hypothetical protein
MKNLKIIFYLLITAVIIASCQKETILLPENAELDNQKIEATDLKSYKSILEIIESGVDLKSYLSSLNTMKKMEITQTAYILDDFVDSNLQFYYSPEDSPCNSLPTVDFENADYLGHGFPTPLNENSDNSVFSPGYILPGISFDLPSSPSPYNAFFIASENSWSMPNVLMSNYSEGDLVITFTAVNVTYVSMRLFNLYSFINMNVYVYGASDVFLGSTSVSNAYWYEDGVYWGVKSEEPITKIVISSDYVYGYEGVDDVSFGTCDDFDGDGILNENDAHPNSDMSEFINIGGCYPNVKNVLVKNGSTMMDQISDLIAQINSQYNGDNYTYLHKKFMSELAQITYTWRRASLITTTERAKISSCAWSASIPYYNMD